MSALLLIVIILIAVGLVIGLGFLFFSGANVMVQSMMPGFPFWDFLKESVFLVGLTIMIICCVQYFRNARRD